MLPHTKEMVTSYKDKPFAFLGVNSDGDRSVVQKMIQKEGINYRNAIDGTTSGPLATAWNVRGWPTAYVIDAKGVIRKKFLGVDPAELTKVVEELFKEMGGS